MRWTLMSLLVALLLVGCPTVEPEPEEPTPGDMEPVFSFAVIGDPHVTSDGEHRQRLQAAVDHINEVADERLVELVLVVGDVGWGTGGGLELARDTLATLDPMWVPIPGDNELHSGEEALWGDVFADHYGALEEELDGFGMAPVPSWNPEHERDSWFRNGSFSWKGVHFVTLDWISRDDGLMGEFGDIHDFEGGSMPFFEERLTGLPDGRAEDIVLAAHHPMHPGSFTIAEMERIGEVTTPLASRVSASYGGHYHADAEEPSLDGGFQVVVVDATWDDLVRYRLVEVWGNEVGFEYEHEIVEVPW